MSATISQLVLMDYRFALLLVLGWSMLRLPSTGRWRPCR